MRRWKMKTNQQSRSRDYRHDDRNEDRRSHNNQDREQSYPPRRDREKEDRRDRDRSPPRERERESTPSTADFGRLLKQNKGKYMNHG